MADTMHALTLHPEWCPPILSDEPAAKRCENRSWPLPAWAVGVPIALHAGARVAGRYKLSATLDPFSALDLALCGVLVMGDDAGWGHALNAVRFFRTIVTGAVVGVVVFSGCDQKQITGWDVPGQWHWRISSVQRLASPVPCRGFQQFWHLPADVESAVLAQIGAPDGP